MLKPKLKFFIWLTLSFGLTVFGAITLPDILLTLLKALQRPIFPPLTKIVTDLLISFGLAALFSAISVFTKFFETKENPIKPPKSPTA
jgi:hypothetical protein